jgi:hypothetical protein
VVVRGITAAGAGLATQAAGQLSDAQLTEVIATLVDLPMPQWAAMSAAGQRLIDGHGAARIADALAPLTYAAPPPAPDPQQTPAAGAP